MADKSPARSPKEIEADLEATRNRLSRTVDELAYRVSPETLKSNAKAKVDAQVHQLVGRAKGTVVDEGGDARLDNIAKGLGGVAAGALTLGVLRRIFYRG
jgi:hypothetical protein